MTAFEKVWSLTGQAEVAATRDEAMQLLAYAHGYREDAYRIMGDEIARVAGMVHRKFS